MSERVNAGNVRTLGELLGMNLYTKESLLCDRYGCTVDRRSGKLRIVSAAGKCLWQVEEDCVSTFEARMWRDLGEKYAIFNDFVALGPIAASGIDVLQRVYDNADLDGIKEQLLSRRVLVSFY